MTLADLTVCIGSLVWKLEILALLTVVHAMLIKTLVWRVDSLAFLISTLAK
jgi:hypothetical protein